MKKLAVYSVQAAAACAASMFAVPAVLAQDAPVARSSVTGLDPEIMGLGPVEAIRQALARAGMTIDDIDLVEINEAFAAQVIPSAKHLGIRTSPCRSRAAPTPR